MINLVCCTYLVNAMLDEQTQIFCNLEIAKNQTLMVGTCPVLKGLAAG